ncbi:MAG: thioredoxin family protein [Novosphingobium sp.]|nr:thioredoxin family protein [Novosphingobium sp.]
MHGLRRLLAAFLIALVIAVPAHAAPTHIAASLVVEDGGLPGGTVTVAIRMQPGPGWHGYWLNPGDAGLGMELDWSLPSGMTAGEPRYPVPQTLMIAGLMNHVYEREFAVLVPMALPADARAGRALAIAVDARWLACTDEICVPEQARLETAVTVGAPGKRDPRFDAWRAALPAPLGARARFAVEGATLRLGIPLPASMALESPHFFAGQDKVVDYPAVQRFSRKGDMLMVELARPASAPATPDRIAGVLRLNHAGDGVEVEAVPGPVPTGGEPLAVEGGSPALPALGWLLLAALAGGFLLNVMPCVFPILSLKALSLARAGESEARARAEGVAYTAGVVLACLALGGLLLALRAGGEQVGWAFQLQEPWVVAALLLLAVALTANFFGLFEFAVPGFVREGHPAGAFATGLLAAFVATPCTGPFMAAAMGAALLLPVPSALALFAALGLGIALPFLLIAFVPSLRRALPRPGPWMAAFRRWMALPMGLTALALLWLASRLGGAGFALAAALCAVALVVALWLAGRAQRGGRSARIASVAALAIGAVSVAALPHAVRDSPIPAEKGMLDTQPFSKAALDRARAEGKPVFAWFTADWCLTCKVNERVAIEREDVRDAFAKAGVVVLKGDWTRRDPAITRYLTEQGAAGVPLYVWYPAQGEPRQLPQVLTPDALTSLVR